MSPVDTVLPVVCTVCTLGSRAQAGREFASLWLAAFRFLGPYSVNWVGGTHILSAMCLESDSHCPSHFLYICLALMTEPCWLQLNQSKDLWG